MLSTVSAPILRRRVLVASEDHPLRKLIASVLRCDGIDAIETIADESALVEIGRSQSATSWSRPLDVVVLDGRRDKRNAIRMVSNVREMDLSARLVVIVRDTELDDALSCYGAVPLRTPLTATSLRATIAAQAPWLQPQQRAAV